MVFVTDDPARSALDATFVRKEHPPIVFRAVAVCRAAVYALLSRTFQARVGIDDPNVGSIAVNVKCVERELDFDRRWIEDRCFHLCLLKMHVSR